MNDFLDSLDFLKDEEEIKSDNRSIEILIVDDNEDVHKITELILVDFVYENYNFIISHAYSGKQLREIMENKNNVAIVLLDVVMETDSAGLDAVKYIREDLKNEFVRIILRTGQPGKAPEDDVIRNYDINNYIAKTEGSVQKIYTALYSAIRSYRDLLKIYYSKIGLEKVVESSKELYKYKSLMSFYEGILLQLSNLLDFNDNAFIASKNYKMSGAILYSKNNEETILAGIGNFKNLIDRKIKDVFSEEIVQKIREQKHNGLKFYDTFYIGCWMEIEKGIRNYIYFETAKKLDETEKKLVKLTINNFSLAISNFILNKEINESQRKMIFKLGDVIETRLRDNHNHIYRVSKISSILAEAYGFSKKEIDLITLTAPLHDIGKISIPDEILLKPGKLTFEEFEEMKKHSINGYSMINVNNKSSVFSVAGEIALHHHEKWNGLGYPDKLKGEEISKFSRIVSVADVFDALAHKRAYKDAWSIKEIKAFMLEEKGESFEPLIVDLLLENMEKILKILKEYPSY